MRPGARASLGGGVKAGLTEAARAAAPDECCGALLGTTDFTSEWHVARTIELTNRSAHTEREYLITSDDVRFAQRKGRVDGLDVVGFFHSHPAGPAQPSASDLARAWPGYLYIIVAADEVHAWTLDPDRDEFLAVDLSA